MRRITGSTSVCWVPTDSCVGGRALLLTLTEYIMNDATIKSISKFLSLVLRHKPEVLGLELDDQGWADIDQLLCNMAAQQRPVSREQLEMVVETNDKKRFAFNGDKTRIRASQGHSVPVALVMAALEPPECLYHGTVDRFMEAIRAEGLKKMSRQQVHLSVDRATAERVGSRRGRPVILVVQAAKMHREGLLFYRSENGVWLTDAVPPHFISFKNEGI